MILRAEDNLQSGSDKSLFGCVPTESSQTDLMQTWASGSSSSSGRGNSNRLSKKLSVNASSNTSRSLASAASSLAMASSVYLAPVVKELPIVRTLRSRPRRRVSGSQPGEDQLCAAAPSEGLPEGSDEAGMLPGAAELLVVRRAAYTGALRLKPELAIGAGGSELALLSPPRSGEASASGSTPALDARAPAANRTTRQGKHPSQSTTHQRKATDLGKRVGAKQDEHERPVRQAHACSARKPGRTRGVDEDDLAGLVTHNMFQDAVQLHANDSRGSTPAPLVPRGDGSGERQGEPHIHTTSNIEDQPSMSSHDASCTVGGAGEQISTDEAAKTVRERVDRDGADRLAPVARLDENAPIGSGSQSTFDEQQWGDFLKESHPDIDTEAVERPSEAPAHDSKQAQEADNNPPRDDSLAEIRVMRQTSSGASSQQERPQETSVEESPQQSVTTPVPTMVEAPAGSQHVQIAPPHDEVYVCSTDEDCPGHLEHEELAKAHLQEKHAAPKPSGEDEICDNKAHLHEEHSAPEHCEGTVIRASEEPTQLEDDLDGGLQRQMSNATSSSALAPEGDATASKPCLGAPTAASTTASPTSTFALAREEDEVIPPAAAPSTRASPLSCFSEDEAGREASLRNMAGPFSALIARRTSAADAEDDACDPDSEATPFVPQRPLVRSSPEIEQDDEKRAQAAGEYVLNGVFNQEVDSSDGNAIKAVGACMQDSRLEVRLAAVKALSGAAAAGDEAAVQAIGSRLQDEGPMVQRLAIRVLEDAALTGVSAAVAAVNEQLSHKESRVRAAAARALAKPIETGNKAALQAVISQLDSNDASVRALAVDMLRSSLEAGHPEALPGVCRSLQDADARVRYLSLSALTVAWERGLPLSADMIRVPPEESNAYVRRSAEDLLLRIERGPPAQHEERQRLNWLQRRNH